VTQASTTLYLVRHGETEWNATDRCQGTADIPMSAEGRAQIASLAASLRDVAFDAAYASPLARAQETAAIVLGRSPLPLTILPALVELSYGAWQGLTPAEWPDAAAERWERDPWSVTFPDGESLAMVRQRTAPVLAKLAETHPGETVLVCAHGHVNRVLLIEALGMLPEQFWDIDQPNGGVHKLELRSGVAGVLR
jgi:broad specificity phosphatase PhoE